MAGSKSEAPLVVLYNIREDEATWAVKSVARRAEDARPDKYCIIWDDDPSYSQYEEMAGPRPTLLVEEVSQSPQGENNG